MECQLFKGLLATVIGLWRLQMPLLGDGRVQPDGPPVAKGNLMIGNHRKVMRPPNWLYMTDIRLSRISAQTPIKCRGDVSCLRFILVFSVF